MAEPRIQRVRPPIRGLNTRTTVLDMPPDQSDSVTDTRFDVPGVIAMRGAVSPIKEYNLAASTSPVGAVVHGGNILVGHATTGGGTFSDVFGEQFTEAQLIPAIHRVDAIGATSAIMAGAFGTTDGFCPANTRYARLGDLTYYLTAVTAATAARTVSGSASVNSRRVGSWDGTNAGTPIIARNTGPMYGADIAAYAERLWVLGGTVPNAVAGGGAYSSSALYYSDAGGPVTDTLALWQDDVSGLANQINVGDRDQDDYGVGMCQINNGLVVFKRNSIWVLRGSGPQTFQIRCFSHEIGCNSTTSITPWRDGVIFQSDTGFFYFDGAQLREIATGVDWRRALPLIVASLNNDYFLITSASNTTHYLLYAPTDAMCKFSNNVMEDNLRFVKVSGRYPIALDGYAAFDLGAVGGGSTLVTQVYGRDRDKALVQSSVQMSMNYPPAKCGHPGLSSQILRVSVDYKVRNVSVAAGTVQFAASDPHTGANDSVVDNATLLYDTSIVAQPQYLNRATVDVRSEMDLCVVNLGVSASEAVEIAVLGDVYVESAPSRASRTRRN